MKALVPFLALLAVIVQAHAHDSRPLAVAVEELEGGVYALGWRAPPSVDAANAPMVALGEPCFPLDGVERGALTGRMRYRCPGGLAGAALSVRYPYFNPSLSSVVRVEWASGEVSTALLGPGAGEWTAPPPESFAGVAKSYFALGVEHILKGLDHILFLIGLLILARTPRRVLITVTGFTIAHSVTLALVALDAVRVSVPAIEALIALSIVFVAAEIARGERQSVAWRRPAVVACAFGLLHGAGFAAVLGEIGLPQTERVAALLFFNLGVEAGQVFLVLAAFGWLSLIRRARALAQGGPAPFPRAAARLAGYGLGAVSGVWFIERAAAALA